MISPNIDAHIDAHTHAYGHEANAPLHAEEMIQKAIECGLATIYLMDHFTFPPGFEDPTPNKTDSISGEKFILLSEEQKRLKELYADKIEILFGAEVDYLPEYIDATREMLTQLPLDFITGSVHYIDTYTDEYGNKINLNIDGRHSWGNIEKTFPTNKEFVQAYYRRVRDMVESGIFHSCSHLDLVKKYNVDPQKFDPDEVWYKEEVEKTLETISNKGMSIEINTSGLYKACHEIYPAEWILIRACELGIPVTIGSDAHKPEDVGRNHKEAIQYAIDAGYKEICKYVNRERVFVQI